MIKYVFTLIAIFALLTSFINLQIVSFLLMMIKMALYEEMLLSFLSNYT